MRRSHNLIRGEKNWDVHVSHAEEIARGAGFCAIRDRIVELAQPRPGEVVVDVGAGTGLLALELAARGLEVWAIDISPSMCEYLETKASSGGVRSMHVSVASAVSLPLVDAIADLVVSNYCFHHLDAPGKRQALAEAHRVLKPGGRLVFGDMMFGIGAADARDRRVVRAKIVAMLRKGPAGVIRLARNAARLVTGRWEQPARASWWAAALIDAGFVATDIELLDHEGGIARGQRKATAEDVDPVSQLDGVRQAAATR